MVVTQNSVLPPVNGLSKAQAMEAGKHIHHKMCGYRGERMVKAWVLMTKVKKNR